MKMVSLSILWIGLKWQNKTIMDEKENSGNRSDCQSSPLGVVGDSRLSKGELFVVGGGVGLMLWSQYLFR